MNKNILQQIVLRLKSESPKFYRVMQIFSAIVVVASVGFGLLMKYELLDFPKAANINSLLFDLAKGFGGMFFMSLLGTTDPKLMDEQSKDNVINHEQNN